MIGKITVLFSRRLGKLESRDESVKKLESHINYMQEQLEFRTRQYETRIAALELAVQTMKESGV